MIKSPGAASAEARGLLNKFGSLSAVLDGCAQGSRTTRSHQLISAVNATIHELARARLSSLPDMSDAEQVCRYLSIAMAHLEWEETRALFLDRNNRLLRDVRLGNGGAGAVTFYPREIFRVALACNATALIMAHNHPSGDPTPSNADIEVTRELGRIGGRLGITLHDHLIIARGGCVSLRSMGLME